MNKLKLQSIVFILVAVSLCFSIWENRQRFLRPYDYNYFGNLFSESQYIKGQLSKGGIGDDGLYAFAGYYYLMGGDISQVSFESPPLAKYFIGLSALIFGNELVINIIYGIGLIVVVYKIAFILTKNSLIGAISALVTVIDPLVTNHFFISLLDLPMTLFFLSGIYWLIKGTQSSSPTNSFIASATFFSLSFTTRFFPILPFILLILSFGLLVKGNKYWKPFVLFLVFLMPSIYLMVHAAFFIYHPSLIEFFRYQLWIINWRRNDPFMIGNSILTLFTGHYRSWWEPGLWLTAKDWSLLTPLVILLGAIGFWKARKLYSFKLIGVVSIFFLFYTATLTVGVAKYILPVYPLFIISCVFLVITGIAKVRQWKK